MRIFSWYIRNRINAKSDNSTQMPTTSRSLLNQITDLQDALEGYSFENLSTGEALKLKHKFEAFRQRIEQHIWNPQAPPAESGDDPVPLQAKKASLIAAMRRELRIPLNAIIENTNLLGEVGIPEHQMRYVEAIRSASESMIGFVEQLSDPSGSETLGSQKAPFPDRTHSGGLRGKRIMVFEDNPLNMKLIETRLKSWGCEVIPVLKAPYGMSLLHESRVDLILMDLRMPGMDGFEAARNIRQHSNKEIRAIPIIAVTADCTANDGEKCNNAGIDDIVLKPFTADELAATLTRHLNLRKSALAGIRSEAGPKEPSQLFSLDVLWEECSGDLEMLEHMVGLFRANLLEFLGNLRIHMEAPNYPEIRAAAHKVKAGVKLLQAESWLRTIERIHQLSREEQGAAEIQTLYNKLLGSYDKIEIGLKQRIQAYQKNEQNGN